MEPPEIAVEVLVAMPRKPRRKSLIWLWRLLTVWMCRAALAGGAVECRPAATGAGWLGDEQGIAGDDRLQRLLHALCEAGRVRLRVAPARSAATVGQLAREAAFAGLAAAPARLAVQLRSPFRLSERRSRPPYDPGKPVRRLAHRRQEAVAPAMRRARRNPAALGCLTDASRLRQATREGSLTAPCR